MEFITQAYADARRAARIVRELGKKKRFSTFASIDDHPSSSPVPFQITGCWIPVLGDKPNGHAPSPVGPTPLPQN